MNSQTIHDLNEAVRKLNEDVIGAIKLLGGSYDVRTVPLTIRDLEEAFKRLDTVILTNLDDAAPYIDRGNAYFHIRDYDNAISYYTKAININSGYAKAYYYRGDAYFCKGDYDGAIADYGQVIQMAPNYAEVYYARSEAFDCKCALDEANDDSDKAIQLGFDLLSHIEAVCIELIDDVVQLCPRNAKSYYYRGLVHDSGGSYDLAIADYNKAVGLNPKFAEVYHARAEAYENRSNYYGGADYDKVISDCDEAISDYDKAQRLGYGYRGNDPTIELFFNKGENYAEKGDYKSAIADMNEVISRDDSFNAIIDEFVLRIDEDIFPDEDDFPSDCRSSSFGSDPAGRAYNNRGYYYYKVGEFEQGIADLLEALRLYNEKVELDPSSNPDFATIYLNLGSIYHAKGDNDRSTDNYDNLVRLCSNYETDFIDSKFAYGGQDAVEDAIELLKGRINSPPENPSDFYYTGVLALLSNNDGTSAKWAFQIALLMGYDDKDKINQHLANLKNRK